MEQRPEDLLRVPGTNWIVTSSLSATGGLYLIDLRDKSNRRIYPSTSARERLDTKTYASCPGRLDEESRQNFVTAGIALRPIGQGRYTLYAVHFGRVSSVQVFELDVRPGTPEITRVGCVIAPADVWLNSIASLPEGGFVATKFLPRTPGSEALRARVMAGEVNGEVWEWHAGTGWAKVPGTEASGANGIEVSRDGKWIYLSAWGSQSYLRLSRGISPAQRQEVRLDFRPDNFHWAPDGMLLGAGQTEADGTRVVKIDPDTLEVTLLLDKPATAQFFRGTAAIEVDGEIWVGASRIEHIAIFSATAAR